MTDRATRLLLVLLAGIILGFLLCVFLPLPHVDAQGVGIFGTAASGTRTNCTQITGPVAGQTFCLDQSTNSLQVWTGSAWQIVTFSSATQAVAVGGASSADALVKITGTFTPSDAQSYHLFDNATTLVPANRNAFGWSGAPTFSLTAGTNTTLGTMFLAAPILAGNATATITNLDTLTVVAAATGAATNTNALHVTGPARFDNSTATTSFIFGGTNPVATSANNNFWRLTGSFTGSASGTTGLALDSSLTGVTNGDIYGTAITPLFVTAVGGTHVNLFGTFANTPLVQQNGAAVTNSATLRVGASPGFGTNALALSVGAGPSKIDGGLTVGPTTGAATATGAVVVASGISLNATQTLWAGSSLAGTPVCSNNCGTGPSLVGNNTAMRVTMGTGTPTTPFLVLYNGAWTGAPGCIAQLTSPATTAASVSSCNATTTGALINTVVNPPAGAVYTIHTLGVQ